MTDWLAICLHAVFVVDRVEPPYAIVEWAETANFSEIPQNQFPVLPKEGTTWVLHFVPNDGEQKERSELPQQNVTVSIKANSRHKDLNYDIQISSIIGFHAKL